MLYRALLAFSALLPFQFALNPTEGIDLAVVRVVVPAMFLIWLARAIKNKESLPKKNAVACLLVALLILAAISLSFSHNLPWSLRKLAFWISLFPLYFVAVSLLESKEKQRSVLTALVAGASAVAAFGILQFSLQFIFGIDRMQEFLSDSVTPFFLGKSFSESVRTYPSWLINSGGTTLMRAFATFPDPHMFSYYMGILLPWSVALWSTSKSHKKWFFAASFALFLADILSFTRGGYIALVAAILPVLPLVTPLAAKKLLAAAASIILLFAITPHLPVGERFVSSFDITEGSNQGRLSNWRQALAVVAEHPLGVGIGMYPLAVKPGADYREPIYAHNAYLDIAAELGVISMLVFALMLLSAFRSFWLRAKNDAFFAAGVASITLFGVHSLVENPLFSVHVLALLMLILALAGPKTYATD